MKKREKSYATHGCNYPLRKRNRILVVCYRQKAYADSERLTIKSQALKCWVVEKCWMVQKGQSKAEAREGPRCYQKAVKQSNGMAIWISP